MPKSKPLPVLQNRTKRIALAFSTGPAHLYAVTRGIVEYARARSGWLFTTSGESATLHLEQLRGWRGDGVISILTSEDDVRAARRFRKRGIPVVTFSGALANPGVPRVRVSNSSIGRLAADHLLECGYRQFGFYGLEGVKYSTERTDAFATRLRAAGHSCARLLSPNTFCGKRYWEDEVETISSWLATLQRPVGVFAVNDHRSHLISSACSLCNMRIPLDVGILGVDNNQVACEFNSPPLSSIDCDWQRVGFETARLLDSLIHGGEKPTHDILIKPLQVVKRASTTVNLVSDARLAKVLDYIPQHLHEYFGVERLVDVARVSRRTLEGLFAKNLGCSPYDYLLRLRVERAKDLLRLPKPLSVAQISVNCGFSDARALRLSFERLEGLSPTQFRKKRLCGI